MVDEEVVLMRSWRRVVGFGSSDGGRRRREVLLVLVDGMLERGGVLLLLLICWMALVGRVGVRRWRVRRERRGGSWRRRSSVR